MKRKFGFRSVVDNIFRYEAEHQRVLNEAAAKLQFALPHDTYFLLFLTSSII